MEGHHQSAVPVSDGWGCDKDYARNKRKRRGSMLDTQGPNNGDDSPPSQRFVVDDKVCNQEVIEAIRRNEKGVVELLMTFLSNQDLRNVAAVSKEWCSLSYLVMRRRIQNHPFSLLWLSPLGYSTFNFSQHFHPSYVQLNEPSRTPSPQFQGSPPNFNKSPTDKDNNNWIEDGGGHLAKLQSMTLNDVQAVISFSNSEDQYREACDDRQLPDVDIFLFATGPVVFYSNPDLRSPGDSEIGSYGIGLLTQPHPSVCLSSLCIPRSLHFKVECCTVFLNQSVRSTGISITSTGLDPKAMIILKLCNDWMIERCVNSVLATIQTPSFEVPIISQDCIFLDVAGKTCKNRVGSPLAVILSVCGNANTSVTAVEILPSDHFEEKFKQLSDFIDEDPRKKDLCYFALLFSFTPSLSTGGTDLSRTRQILASFQSRFPSIPIQGTSSDRPVNLDVATSSHFDFASGLDDQFAQMQCNYEGNDNGGNTVIILVVKYPHAGFTPSTEMESMELDEKM